MRIKSLFLILIFTTSASANEGGAIAGDGGHGVYCGKIPGKMVGYRQTVLLESLDLFEARRLYKSSWFSKYPSASL